MKTKKLLPLVAIFFTTISVSLPASAYSKSELKLIDQNLINEVNLDSEVRYEIVLDRLYQKEIVISNVLPFDGVLGLFNAIF